MQSQGGVAFRTEIGKIFLKRPDSTVLEDFDGLEKKIEDIM